MPRDKQEVVKFSDWTRYPDQKIGVARSRNRLLKVFWDPLSNFGTAESRQFKCGTACTRLIAYKQAHSASYARRESSSVWMKSINGNHLRLKASAI